MKLVNETKEKHLEELKKKAIERYINCNKSDMEQASRLARIDAYALFVVASGLLYSFVKGAAMEEPSFIVFCGVIILIETISLVRDVVKYSKYRSIVNEPLTDEKKKEIIEADEVIQVFNEDVDTYAKLEKMKILEYLVKENKVILRCEDTGKNIEEIEVVSKVEHKEDIKKPVLTLTEDGFVFTVPSFTKC